MEELIYSSKNDSQIYEVATLMENGNDFSSTTSFNSSSYFSNECSSHNIAPEPVENSELLSLSKLRSSLEKLLLNAEYDYSDAEIVVEGVPVGVNRCILAARSEFFQKQFKKESNSSGTGGKPRYLITDLVPHGRVGFEAFNVVLHYLYTGKLKACPPEVSNCVDDSCAHDACGPAISYAVELMYASAEFQMKELILLVQRRLLNFIEKAFVEDVIPILIVAFHCKLSQLIKNCVQRVARSDLDDITLEQELPHELLSDINTLRLKSKHELDMYTEVETDPLNEKRIRRILKALESNDVELLGLLLEESKVTLDNAYALHYAAAYCNPKIVNEVLGLCKANVNLKNPRGYTVLHIAARRKDPAVIVALLKKGASVFESSVNGETAITICRRLTRPKDYNEDAKQGKETNKDKLCIDVLEREIRRDPMTWNVPISSAVVADELIMRLLFLENRVDLARMLFPLEAKVAMQLAHADSTLAFAGLSALRGASGSLREVDLNEIPSDQVKRLQLRLQALTKTVENGRRFFPNCSAVLDELLEDDMLDSLLLEKGTPEEQRSKKMRYTELKEEVMKAFNKDKAENTWSGFSTASSSTSSPKSGANRKGRKK